MNNILKLPSAEQIENLSIQNRELASGFITPDGFVFSDIQNTKSILLGIKSIFEQDLELRFQMSKDGIEWFDWYDGFGEKVIINVKNGNNIIGPIHGFPYLEYARILMINAGDIDGALQEVSYGLPIANISSTQREGNGQTVDYAFNHQTYTVIEEGFILSLIAGEKYVQVELETSTVVSKISMWGRDGSTTLKNFIIKGSNDGTNFDVLFEGVLERDGTSQSYNIPNNTPYLYYKIDCIDNYGGNSGIAVQDVRLYSADLSVPVFVQGIM